jgi:hypothetical protein
MSELIENWETYAAAAIALATGIRAAAVAINSVKPAGWLEWLIDTLDFVSVGNSDMRRMVPKKKKL